MYNYYGAYDSFIPSRSLFFHMDVTKFSSNTATSGIMGSVVEEGIKINDNILFMSVDIFKCYWSNHHSIILKNGKASCAWNIVLSASTFPKLLTFSTMARITNVGYIFSVMKVQWTKEWNKLTTVEAMLYKWNIDCNCKTFYKQIRHNKELLRIAKGNTIKGNEI